MATTAGELANRHAGVIEAAIRRSVAPGMILRTVPARAQFEVQKLSEGALVLLFGKKRTRTAIIPWPCLESVMRLLVKGDRIEIRSVHDVGGDAGIPGRPHQVERWTGKDDWRLRRGSSGGIQGRRRGFEPASQNSAQQGHRRRRTTVTERWPCLGGRRSRAVLTRLRCAQGYGHNCPRDGSCMERPATC